MLWDEVLTHLPAVRKMATYLFRTTLHHHDIEDMSLEYTMDTLSEYSDNPRLLDQCFNSYLKVRLQQKWNDRVRRECEERSLSFSDVAPDRPTESVEDLVAELPVDDADRDLVTRIVRHLKPNGEFDTDSADAPNYDERCHWRDRVRRKIVRRLTLEDPS